MLWSYSPSKYFARGAVADGDALKTSTFGLASCHASGLMPSCSHTRLAAD